MRRERFRALFDDDSRRSEWIRRPTPPLHSPQRMPGIPALPRNAAHPALTGRPILRATRHRAPETRRWGPPRYGTGVEAPSVIAPLHPWPISGFHYAAVGAVLDTLATLLPFHPDIPASRQLSAVTDGRECRFVSGTGRNIGLLADYRDVNPQDLVHAEHVVDVAVNHWPNARRPIAAVVQQTSLRK